MKFRNLFFSFFFCFVFIISLYSNSNIVSAQEYYNHLENSSFTSLQNICEDSGFESGSLESGLIYGNWSAPSGGASISSSSPLTGIYHGSISGGGGYELRYTLDSDFYVLGADIQELSFWAKDSSAYGGITVRVLFYYSDASSDYTDYVIDSTYEQIDCTSDIDTSKVLTHFRVYRQTGSFSLYIDDFVFTVLGDSGQDSITTETSPWYTLATPANNFGYINEVTGRLDNTSVQFSGYVSTSQGLGQSVNYIDTDYIQFIDTYVYSADVSSGDGLRCVVVYSDRTEDYRDKYVTGDGSSWEYVNFGVSWITPNKYVIAVYFKMLSDGSYVTSWILDDFGIWSSVSPNFSRFKFFLSPTPISSGVFDFEAYSGSVYDMHCCLYNSTSEALDENGTYTVFTSLGSVSGNMVNGVFNVSLSIRSFSTSPYTVESIGITIVVSGSSEVLYFELTAYWYPTSGSSEIPSVTVDSDFLTDFVVIGMILLMPSMLFAVIGAQISPSMGMISFVGGLTLMSAISLRIGLINIWFMFAIIIIDVLIIAEILKVNGNNG